MVLGAFKYLPYFAILLIIVPLIFLIPIIKFDGGEKQKENRMPDNYNTWKATFSFIRQKLLPILVFSMALNSILIIMDILGAPLILYSIGGGPELYGLFMGSFSLGGLIGAILIPRIRIQRIWILIIGYFAVTGASLFAMGVEKNATIVISLPFFIGFMASFSNIPFMSYLQKLIPGSILGKTTSFIESVALGLSPVAAVIMSFAGNSYGVNTVFWMSGLILLLITITIPITSVKKITLDGNAEKYS